MAGRFAVVDEENRFVRWTDRGTLHRERLPHRSIHVALFDEGGRLVVQRRHTDKETFPGYWDMSASGHVEESDYVGGPDERLDEVYAGVAQRELEEELGVVTELRFLGWFAPEAGVHYEHIGFYTGVHDGPYVIQPEEVLAVKAVGWGELEGFAEEHPITNSLKHFAPWLHAQGIYV